MACGAHRRAAPPPAREHRPVRVVIEGHDLPGRRFLSDGTQLTNVHVAVQVRTQPHDPVRGDATTARWQLAVGLVTGDAPDFRGPAVHGRRGERFIYLTWGEVDADGGFAMFRRAKLMLDRIDPDLIGRAAAEDRALVGRVQLSDGHGCPRCARVDPPAVSWTLG
jgi:hypothetical protein